METRKQITKGFQTHCLIWSSQKPCEGTEKGKAPFGMINLGSQWSQYSMEGWLNLRSSELHFIAIIVFFPYASSINTLINRAFTLQVYYSCFSQAATAEKLPLSGFVSQLCCSLTVGSWENSVTSLPWLCSCIKWVHTYGYGEK